MTFNKLAYIALSAIIWTTILMEPSVWPNHYYFLGYLSIGFCTSKSVNEKMQSASIVTGLAIGFSVIQKLISPQFMSGDFMGFYILNGQMFSSVLSLLDPIYQNITIENVQISNYSMNNNVPLLLNTRPWINPMLFQFLGISALIFEGLVATTLLRKNWLDSKFSTFILISFLFSLMITRPEYLFVSILSYSIFCISLVKKRTKTTIFLAIFGSIALSVHIWKFIA